MEAITGIIGMSGSFLGYVVPFLFVLTIVVFFHELGHFLVARWAGVTVETFSIGFGREIYGWYDSKGTRWKISWVPLGGYVKFQGDENAASMPSRAAIEDMPDAEKSGNFHQKPVLHRMAVVVAGPVANFILAIVIFAALFVVLGERIAEPIVDEVRAESAAEAAGFMVGDRVVEIDGTAIESFGDMQRIVSASAGEQLEVFVERGGLTIALLATPKSQEITDRFGNVHRIGLLGIGRNATESNVRHVRYDPFTAVWMGVGETWFIISRTFEYLGGIISGKESADQLGGPLRIAQVSGQVATIGFSALIHLAAVLSVSIGLINLFPVPMLDGGHLLYYTIEAVRGRPVGDEMQEYGYRVGLALVMMLMVFATWNDLVHLQVFEFLSNLLS
ncbi:MAG: RIP metalloprotease RseP [Rhodobiaceae bacterium]|nr:MAG: RIP metalloprotease RseP [Rhodobiaceae bacterium]